MHMSCIIKKLALAAFIFATPVAGLAADWPTVSWQSRWSEETTNGDIVDHPPFVAVDNVRLSRFSEMQSVTYRDELLIDHGEDGLELLYVFTVWQGGASQGEQLMALSIRAEGIDVIGPYAQDFEQLEISQINADSAPEFRILTEEGEPIETVYFYAGGFRP